jgi:CAAX amino terminal protease family.
MTVLTRLLHPLLFVVLLVAALRWVPAFRSWPLTMLAPLLAYGAVVASVPILRRSFQPWRFGRVSRSTILATAAIALVSCTALALFHVLARPDVSFLKGSLPVSSVGGLVAAGAFFCILNALLEEAIFRGIFHDGLEPLAGRVGAVVLTSVVFGYFHMHGYPPGPLGAVLAGLYGVSLGWLRVFGGGLGPPVLAHIAADATIFVLLARADAL